MSKLRALVGAGYAIGALLVLFPMLEAAVTVWPYRPGEIAWRFGATGLVSRSLLLPLLGVGVLAWLSLVAEHRVLTRVVAVTTALGAIAALVLLGLFGLDAIQVRAQVPPESATAFDLASGAAALRYMAACVAAVLVAIGAWRASRRSEVERKGADSKAPPVLFRTHSS